MLDSPGNYLVIMRRWTETLVLPCTYTGRLVSASGTYQHAVISWEADNSGDTNCGHGPHGETEQYWACVASDMLEVELKPLPFS